MVNTFFCINSFPPNDPSLAKESMEASDFLSNKPYCCFSVRVEPALTAVLNFHKFELNRSALGKHPSKTLSIAKRFLIICSKYRKVATKSYASNIP